MNESDKTEEAELRAAIDRALAGDRRALAEVVAAVKDRVYNLALRMLLYPEDAEDASQEILVRMVTNLSQFRGESAFYTWVYRIASNYLLTARGKRAQAFAVSFDEYAEQIDQGQAPNSRIVASTNPAEQALLEEEVKVSCTHGLLLCLSERARLSYILGEILELPGPVAAEILELSPESFRQQLSRARTRIRNFLEAKCGLANPANPCRCRKKVDHLLENQVIPRDRFRFARHTRRSIELVESIEALDRSLAIYRSTPQLPSPPGLVQAMQELIQEIAP